MTKILTYRNQRDNIVIIVLLIIAIIATNSFIIFSPDENSRFYFSGLTSSLTLAAGLAISIVMVYRYKRAIRKQKEMQQAHSDRYDDDMETYQYYFDNNKIHFSICLFFAFWLAASVNWTFEDQEAPGVLIADILYYSGYASFGYFVYSLYYHFFRNEFEPFILILIGILILVPLIFIVDTIVSTMRLLSTQTVDISLVIVNTSYPILDAIVIFPIALMLWAVRRRTGIQKDEAPKQQSIEKEVEKKVEVEKDKLSSSAFVSSAASIWILLLLIAMVLSAAGDSGFAYTSAFDVTTVQNYIWMWNILYNSDHLCLAAGLFGYKYFFPLTKKEKDYNE
jgi:membrane protein implicated in regulation of membrane protease activity